MERGISSRFGTFAKLVLLIAGLGIAARAYVALVPHSAALGAVVVICAGAVLAFAILHIDRRIAEFRTAVRPADAPVE